MTATPRPRKLKNGQTVWRVQFRLTPGGTPTSETFTTLDAAKRFAQLVDKVGGKAARELRDASDNSATTTPTYAEAANQYLEHLASYASKSHIHGVKARLKLILPTFGELPIDTITPQTITRWIVALREHTPESHATKPLAASTIKLILTTLGAVLRHQIKLGTITKDPTQGIKVARDNNTTEHVFLTANEVATIIDNLPTPHAQLALLLYATGLRVGEATALTVADVDLDSPIPSIRVNKTWAYGDEGGYIGATKTERSKRTVSLPPQAIEPVRELTQGKTETDPLFTNPQGTAIKPRDFRNKFAKAVKNSNLDRTPRVHDLRHSHASALIAAGIPLPVIQRRLGHEKITTTVDTYGHLAPDAAIQAATAIANELSQVRGLLTND